MRDGDGFQVRRYDGFDVRICGGIYADTQSCRPRSSVETGCRLKRQPAKQRVMVCLHKDPDTPEHGVRCEAGKSCPESGHCGLPLWRILGNISPKVNGCLTSRAQRMAHDLVSGVDIRGPKGLGMHRHVGALLKQWAAFILMFSQQKRNTLALAF